MIEPQKLRGFARAEDQENARKLFQMLDDADKGAGTDEEAQMKQAMVMHEAVENEKNLLQRTGLENTVEKVTKSIASKLGHKKGILRQQERERRKRMVEPPKMINVAKGDLILVEQTDMENTQNVGYILGSFIEYKPRNGTIVMRNSIGEKLFLMYNQLSVFRVRKISQEQYDQFKPIYEAYLPLHKQRQP